jgi:putative toxin-antitoxin system antitoxin component (TIGR02293 family)
MRRRAELGSPGFLLAGPGRPGANLGCIGAKATRVLGSQEEAELWLKRPAIGLDQQRPIDLLTTPAGVKLVEDYLGRLEYDGYT